MDTISTELTVVYEIVIAAVVLIVLGYFVSLILHKRTFDIISTQLNSSQAAMVSLLSQYAYYGLYERSEILRTIANTVGINMLQNTVMEVEHYPPPPQPYITTQQVPRQ